MAMATEPVAFDNAAFNDEFVYNYEGLSKEFPDVDVKSRVVFLKLDLASLKSCQEAAKEFLSKESRLDILSELRFVLTFL